MYIKSSCFGKRGEAIDRQNVREVLLEPSQPIPGFFKNQHYPSDATAIMLFLIA